MTTKVTSREYLWLTVYSTLHDLHLYLSVVFLVVRSVAKYLGNPGRYSEASGFVARGGIGIVASNATDSVLRLRQISLGIAVRKGVSHFLACLSFARARAIWPRLPGRDSEDLRRAPLFAINRSDLFGDSEPE